MPYIGNTPDQQAFTPAIDYFSGNGSTVAFTLSRPVASVAQVQVVVNNVAQNPGTAFTVSGQTLTFTGAPSSGTNNIYVYYTSPITQVIAPGQGTVNTTQLVDGAVTTAKILDSNVTAAKLASGVARSNWGAGGVLQVVQTVVTSQFSTTNTAPTATGLSASITPSSTTSKILVMVTANLQAVNSPSGNCYVNPTLKRGATQIWDGFAQVGNFNSTDIRGIGGINYLDSPATTSPTTYELYINATYATTVRMNGSSGTSTITLMEIAA